MMENIYKGAKIVVIDDVEEVLTSIKNCLRFDGMDVTCFVNPKEGLEYLKNNKADVLLLDFFMPEMNGDDFVEQLRAFNKETIIILQTGYSDKIPPLDMIDKMNIQGYLDKTRGEDELILMTKAAVRTYLLNKQLREKDKEIAKISYKKAIMGNLITNLVNEAKNQLMQIGSMNEVIKMDTDKYEIENRTIKNALENTYELYQAINFENLTECELSQFYKIIEKLLHPTMLVNGAVLKISNNNTIRVENVSNNIYLVVKICEILIQKQIKNMTLKDIQENEKNYFEITYDGELNNLNIDELEWLDDANVVSIDNKSIKIKYN